MHALPLEHPDPKVWKLVTDQAPLIIEADAINVVFLEQGNFTIAVARFVELPDNDKSVLVGVTKRHCKLDKYNNQTRAQATALGRALMDFRVDREFKLNIDGLDPEVIEALKTAPDGDLVAI